MHRNLFLIQYRSAGLILGSILLLYGALGFWAAGHLYAGETVQRLCRAWACPDEFSTARVFELQQLAGTGAQAVFPVFQRALEEDSASAYSWANLGEEEEKAENIDKAGYCFEQALKAAPRNPAILFRAANYDFRLGREDALLQNLRNILRNPELTQYYENVYLTYSRLSVPFAQILELGMPPLSTPANGFLNFLIARNAVEEAKQTWTYIAAHSLADDASAGTFVQLLLAHKEDDLAVSTWETYVAAKAEPGYRHSNWLFNGSFELPLRPSPLDWRLEQDPDVRAERSSEQAKDGKWSVKLKFLGKGNPVYRDSYQFAVAYPGKWILSAQIKTENITTDQGAAIHVFDVWKPQQLDLWSTSVIGTQNWTPITLTFNVQPGTKLLRVDLARQPSLFTDSKISGSAWFDSILLRPAE